MKANTPRLKDVTLCAADCVHRDLAARAVEICLQRAEFADAVVFSDAPVPGRFRTKIIPPLRSLDDYSRFCLHDLAHLVATPFVLIVQWDGYILNPSAWTSQFLRYDYVGAPHVTNLADPNQTWRVGNGGFSLRSRRLLEATATLPLLPGLPEDFAICDTFRGGLERDHGIRFAPEGVGDRFAFDQRNATRPTFGFHGSYNLHRAESDDTVIEIISHLSEQEKMRVQIFTLIYRAIADERFDVARRLYAQVRGNRSREEMTALLSAESGKPDLAARFIDQIEALRERA